MRKFTLFIFLLILNFGMHAQHFKFGSNFRLDVPLKSEMPNAQILGGWDLHFGYSPFARLPLYFEYEATWSGGATRSYDQLFLFNEEYGVIADVTYANKFNRSMLSAKYFLNHMYKPVRPYAAVQIGVGKHKTRMRAIDPLDDEDPSLQSTTTFKDFSGLFGGEVGIEVDFQQFFKDVEEPGHKFNFSLNYLSSFKNFQYTDVRQMTHAPGYNEDYLWGDGAPDNQEPPHPYAWVSSESIYEQKIARVYETKLAYWSVRLGYSFHF